MATQSLTEVYRHFGESVAETSPLYQRVAIALSESAPAMHAIESAPARKRHPALILASLHDLALAGRAPALAAAYTAADGVAAAQAALETVLGMRSEVLAIAERRRPRPDETGHCAVLYPAIAHAAQRTGAETVGLIDLSSTGLNLNVDRVGITYSTGQSLGASSSSLMSAAVVGETPIPDTPMPPVASRIVIDTDPLEVADADDARWLRACVPPDRLAQLAMLEAEIALAAAQPPELLAGDVIELLLEAIARVPAGALPVVLTTWALSRLSPEQRSRFMHRLYAAAVGRTVGWVSVEGVGVASAIPTLGDRPASGHSIIGSAVIDHRTLRAEAVGRCWRRGRMLAWLAKT